MGGRVVAASLLFWLAQGLSAEEWKNWFGDPYFQVRNAMPACPVPRGPFMTEDEMRRSAHARAERGTRCWQEGKCSKSNAYLYDAAIADEAKRRFAASRLLRQASLWVTVQRRFVYVEGCAGDPGAQAGILRLLRDVPDVEQVIVNVYPGPGSGRPGYPAFRR
jgi:hypothetical protein